MGQPVRDQRDSDGDARRDCSDQRDLKDRSPAHQREPTSTPYRPAGRVVPVPEFRFRTLIVRNIPRTTPQGGPHMGLGVSIFLTAVGAILAFAVNHQVNGLNIHTIGWILMIVGVVGFVLSMIFWSSWGGPGYITGARRRTTTYVDDAPPPPGY
ncbi:MAG: DUF6458 family protein [Gaiellaceae bacterium]